MVYNLQLEYNAQKVGYYGFYWVVYECFEIVYCNILSCLAQFIAILEGKNKKGLNAHVTNEKFIWFILRSLIFPLKQNVKMLIFFNII